MPGATGACRIACTTALMPWAECQALCGCIDWKSFVPSITTTNARGECASMT